MNRPLPTPPPDPPDDGDDASDGDGDDDGNGDNSDSANRYSVDNAMYVVLLTSPKLTTCGKQIKRNTGHPCHSPASSVVIMRHRSE